MADHLFDTDCREAVTPAGDGLWEATVSSRWSIDGVPNGGFLMALGLEAAGREIPHPDPLSMNSHFLGRTMPGKAEIRTRVIKQGRSLSVGAVDLVQNGRVTVTSLVTWGDLAGFAGPSGPLLSPPGIPGETSARPDSQMGEDTTFTTQFDYRMPAAIAMGASGQPTGRAEAFGRMRFLDGRPPDLFSMPLITDGFPPAVFQLGHYGWAPTLEMTVHFRARPQPGWLTVSVNTRHLLNGTFEEDCYVWDSTGTLVAMSRQLALTLSG